MSERGGTISGIVTRSNTGNMGSLLVVSLASSDPTTATVPATVTIQPNRTSTTFTINAVDNNKLDGTRTATIAAFANGYVSVPDTVNVTDYETLTVAINDHVVSEAIGAGATTATVTRSNVDNLGAALNVYIASSDVTEATAPAMVTIPAGQASVIFSIATVPDTGVFDGTEMVTFTPSANGYVPGGSDTVAVTDFLPLVLDISSDSAPEHGGRGSDRHGVPE